MPPVLRDARTRAARRACLLSFGYIGAPADHGLDQARVPQVSDRMLDRAVADSVGLHQRADRRKQLPRRNIAALDLCSQDVRKLLPDRRARLVINLGHMITVNRSYQVQ